MKVGDKVTYHGSIDHYHPYTFTIAEIFEFNGIECCRLNGPKMDIWIERCRLSNVKEVVSEA